ncbi:P-loop containing nucleoside triphosphate hydrolase protein [Tribonema minus]|uniref:P-loop containing nucleoside triphosphate hydrolase protein n=1 Tax=Tribonema minus TaxID=303371 RepID=A0A836C7V0_9STRA|nr:P-loop containing nucleoside triphosphate hydrolase protein [Tribonema minus]
MGLGKTLQSIAFMAYLRDTMRTPGPYLIVVPLSVLSNWLIEISRFAPSIRAVRFHGPKDERARIKAEELRDLKEFDAVVTTFEMLVSESNFFRRRFLWRLVVVDEGHRLKNDRSQLAQKLKQVPAYCRVLLTGTPLQNNLKELWALLHFLMPDVFTVASAEKFEEGFDLLRGVCDPQRLRQARALLSVVMLRRVKDQVRIPLPSKTELTLMVRLSVVQHAFYRHLLVSQESSQLEGIMAAAQAKAEERQTPVTDETTKTAASAAAPRQQQPITSVDYRKLMNLLLQLRKVCNHPYLLADFEGDDGGAEALVAASGKLQLLDRMLPRLRADGHRVLLFTQFTSMLDILEEYCIARSHEYARLDGDTNRVQRRLDIRRFNAPASPLFIFLISTRAGGLGINLASADTVILYDSDWNPQVDLQAMERAHRIGQTKPVRVYRMVCRGSVEERMVSRAEKKLYLNAMVAESQADDDDGETATGETTTGETADAADGGGGGSGAAGPGGMSKSELANLIRFGANAIFEAETEDYTDEDLDVLLGRREGTVGGGNEGPGEGGGGGAGATAAATGAGAGGAAAPPPPRTLVEVDLRQLDGVRYERQDRRGGGGGARLRRWRRRCGGWRRMGRWASASGSSAS